MGFIHFLSIGVALITLINQFYIEGMSAPKYLSIEGWKECVESDPIETYEVYCLPKVRKENCSKNAWKQLKKLKGNDKFNRCLGTTTQPPSDNENSTKDC